MHFKEVKVIIRIYKSSLYVIFSVLLDVLFLKFLITSSFAETFVNVYKIPIDGHFYGMAVEDVDNNGIPEIVIAKMKGNWDLVPINAYEWNGSGFSVKYELMKSDSCWGVISCIVNKGRRKWFILENALGYHFFSIHGNSVNKDFVNEDPGGLKKIGSLDACGNIDTMQDDTELVTKWGSVTKMFKMNKNVLSEIWQRNQAGSVAALYDFDKDGINEIIFRNGNPNGQNLSIYKWNKNTFMQIAKSPILSAELENIAVGDTKGKGKSEVITFLTKINEKTRYIEDSFISVFPFDGKTFKQKSAKKNFHATKGSGGYLINGLAVGKLKDKKKDKIVVSLEDLYRPDNLGRRKGKLKIWGLENDAFQDEGESSEYYDLTVLQVADVDGDGNGEIIARSGDKEILIFKVK